MVNERMTMGKTPDPSSELATTPDPRKPAAWYINTVAARISRMLKVMFPVFCVMWPPWYNTGARVRLLPFPGFVDDGYFLIPSFWMIGL